MCAAARARVFDVTELDRRPGYLVFRVSGKTASEVFTHESGGHRIQHVPSHDKRGRVHTSTVTVCVLAEPTDIQVRIDPKDLEITSCRGSGPGGQHRNKTDSAVQIRHRPSGLIVRCESERSQYQNREMALALLRSRIWKAKQHEAVGARARDRREQVGSGARGDKRRTYYFQRDQVVDHVLGKTWKLKSFLRGEW